MDPIVVSPPIVDSPVSSDEVEPIGQRHPKIPRVGGLDVASCSVAPVQSPITGGCSDFPVVAEAVVAHGDGLLPMQLYFSGWPRHW